MAVKEDILFINDAYYKYYMPSTRSIDEAIIISLTRLNQTTLLVDLISDGIYNEIYEKLSTSTPLTGDLKELFSTVQKYLAIRVYLDFYSDDGDGDKKFLATTSKEKVLAARVTRTINNSTELIVLAGGSVDSEFDGDLESPKGAFYM